MPLRKFKENVECPDKPWITSGFKISINKKWSLFHRWKRTKTPEDWLKYTKHLNLLTHLKKKAEIMHYHNLQGVSDKITEILNSTIHTTLNLKLSDIYHYNRKFRKLNLLVQLKRYLDPF